ncbi:MAG TPA: formate--tetrahydrofolate ligase [Candidatus Limnocylindrales bacterium]|nr:formate--tetrahydrofolate ligase [Candidatus Limnocylindrales bacterium]
MTDGMRPVREIADKLGIPDEYMDYYGKYIAKLKLDLLSQFKTPDLGKLILVTAMTPTRYGEGKTIVSIGLAQALEQIGKKAVVTLREPSLGPVFGVKGGATGGGKSKVLPSEVINLHFTGDFHAVTAAHNLLAAMIDSHIHHGNDLRIDVDNIFWPRAVDMNDRALRHIIVGLGGKANGVPRETGFVITAASEIMAILALANSREDLRRRLNEVVIGFDLDGRILRAVDLKATGAMMVLLKEAILPNLVQTSEHTPALIHAGPFANIAHGTSSIISQKMALKLADYVVNETGFGADLGAEKYLDIVMPASGIKPTLAVLVVTIRALASQGTLQNEPVSKDMATLKHGFSNLAKHMENLRKFNLPFVVAINRFPSDTQTEIQRVQDFCRERDVENSIVEVFDKGGSGAWDLASKVITLAEISSPEAVHPLYPLTLSIEEKIETIAKEIYGASSIHVESKALQKLQKFAELGFNHLPVCMAKTESSLSDNPKLPGAPKDWILTVTDAHLSAGAGFIVVVAGNMLLMPGLPKISQATKLDVDETGNIIGLS